MKSLEIGNYEICKMLKDTSHGRNKQTICIYVYFFFIQDQLEENDIAQLI